jgi:N-methylhydantoinase A
MLDAPVVVDAERSILRASTESAAVSALGSELAREVDRVLEREGFDASARSVELRALARYAGQAHELEIPLEGDLTRSFHAVHEARNGYRDESRRVEVVTVRARGTGAVRAPEPARAPLVQGDGAAARIERAPVVFEDGVRETWILEREKLGAGESFDGPAVVVDPTATTVVPPGTRATVDALGNIVLENGSSGDGNLRAPSTV